MFDPTVFDNLKVVVEGDLYDFDLDGDIHVVNRKDLIDLATMSRHFMMDITATNKIIGRVELSSNIENISGELLQRMDRPGCSVKVSFYRYLDEKDMNIKQFLDQWKEELLSIWGNHWKLTLFTTSEFDSCAPLKCTAEIEFDRLFYEDNIDDLRELVVYMVKSIKKVGRV